VPGHLRHSGTGFLPALFCLLLTVGHAAAAVSVNAVRLGGSPTQTRLVFDLSDPGFAYTLDAPDRGVILLRLPGVSLGRGLQPPGPDGLLLGLALVEEDGTLLARIRHPDGCSTLAFRLEAGDGRPDRLVVDLFAPELVSELTPGLPDDVPPLQVDPVPRRRGPRIVVIDPGHGGDDPGAVAGGLREKDIVLDVGRRLAGILNRGSGIRAALTRDRDVRVPLRQRMRKAESEGADLFVSIHVNAARSRSAHGAEVFFLSIGAASDEASRELARLENMADPDYVVEEDVGLQDVPFLVDLRQSDTLIRSSRAAEEILDALTDRELTSSRGVKQAGFVVLKSFQVPSVLVELGFISSENDRRRMATDQHRDRLARALADGIERYFQRYAPRRVEE